MAADPISLVSDVIRLGATLAELILKATKDGDTHTLEALRPLVPAGPELQRLDRLVVEAQRAKAAAELPPG